MTSRNEWRRTGTSSLLLLIALGTACSDPSETTGGLGKPGSGTNAGGAGGGSGSSGSGASSGNGGNGGNAGGAGSAAAPSTGADVAPVSGLRRLTSEELTNVLQDLIGFAPPVSAVPEAGYAFDRDYTSAVVSGALIEGLEQIAKAATEWLLRGGNESQRDKIVGCKPTTGDNEACTKSFVTRFGRRVLRRPLLEAEVTKQLALHKKITDADSARSFYAGVGAVIESFLQNPEFVFRIELGSDVGGGRFKLNGFEIASRLSFLLWGTTPDDALLDRAQAGRLANAADVRAAVTEMLTNVRARDRIARFHALWLGYDRLTHEATLTSAMRAETDALIGRVLFEKKSAWQDLFRSEETFVSDALAKHYGNIPAPGSAQPKWTPYGANARRGLVSHGSFLSIGGKFGDTSPTVRGKLIRERLFCQNIPDPDPALLEQFKVDVDEPPMSGTSPCKWDRYAAQRSLSPVCAGCHQLTDLIGFGLENYDAQGRYRTVDRDRETGNVLSSCVIRGEGEILGIGKFTGPLGLSQVIGDAGAMVNRCVVTQLYRFALGRHALDGWDQGFLAGVQTLVGEKDFRFHELVANLASAEAFLHRRAN